VMLFSFTIYETVLVSLYNSKSDSARAITQYHGGRIVAYGDQQGSTLTTASK
jgi:hypothetical protein